MRVRLTQRHHRLGAGACGDAADDRGVGRGGFVQVGKTGLRTVGGDTEQQAAGGLRVKQQRVDDMGRRLVAGSYRAFIIRFQRALDAID